MVERRLRAVQLRRRDAARGQAVDLVLHQRDQRRDDDGDAVVQERRHLVAERFAAAGRQDYERVAPLQHRGHGLFLQRTEHALPPDGLLYRQQARFGYPLEVGFTDKQRGQLLFDQDALDIGDSWGRQFFGRERQAHPLGDALEHLMTRLIPDGRIGQRVQDFGAVERVAQSLVKQDNSPFVCRGADQAPETLLENDDHFRQQVIVEAVLACTLHGVHAGGLDRIAQAGIGQLL